MMARSDAMDDQTTSPVRCTIAQELGADPEFESHKATGEVLPLSLGMMIRLLTRHHPFVMLGLAFIAGAAFAGRAR
jgi:hypothetical protein